MKYYVTVELYGVEAGSRKEAESIVREQIEQLDLGTEPCEVSAEECYE